MIYLGRALAALLGLILVSVVLAFVQPACDAVVGLQIPLGNLVATILLSTCLAALFGWVAFATACFHPRPSVVYGAGIELAVASYLVVALFSFSPVLEVGAAYGPGTGPLAGILRAGHDLWRYLVLVNPSIALILVGLWADARRDIASG